ncbi:MAG TPA: hypothetical protein VKC61_10735 [Pyrinomonadaceae bacterium]|nr:hypothetical protein [Pyrinomonadaceae bacterium]
MGNEKDSWDMSQERAFVENLFCQRFNFFIVIFSLVIAGAASANTQAKLSAILTIGFFLCLLVALTIYRNYVKLIWILRELHGRKDHPIAISSAGIEQEIFKMLTLFPVNWIIGWFIPSLCCLILLAGALLSFTCVLKAA